MNEPYPSESELPERETGWRSVYPFESRWLTLGGHQLHYLDEFTPLGMGAFPPSSDDQDSGPRPSETLLFVHGNPTWSFHWREMIQRWRTEWRCVAPDHIGCGLSDKPQDWSYRLADHIDNLVALIESRDLREITLVAQDWGGAIGLGAALRVPERFARFVLFNTGAFPPWFIPWRIRVCRFPVLGRLAVQGGNLFSRAALRMTMTHAERLTAAEREGYLAPYGQWADRVGVYQFVQDIPLSPNHPTYATLAEIEAGLPSLSEKPFQFIWGMKDWCFTPECLDKFVSLLPEAKQLRLPETGHWVVEDAPEVSAHQIERFIATSSNRESAVDSIQ